MNSFRAVSILLLTAVLCSGPTACKKTPKGPTPIPGSRGAIRATTPPAPLSSNTLPLGVNDPTTTFPRTTNGGIPTTPLEEIDNMLGDREILKASTVHFEFDRSTVLPAERPKVEEVAAFLRTDPTFKLLIEGHCDERGTEEYNRALGERRALALRETLAGMGIGPERVRTLSYGEDRPADLGHDEGAWQNNRRGEFVLLKPKPSL